MNTLHLPRFNFALPSKSFWLALLCCIGLFATAPSFAVDLVTFAGVTGPLAESLKAIASLGPGVKALIGVIAFVVALITLAALRDFGPVLRYIGVTIFGATGLVVGGAIMGMTI